MQIRIKGQFITTHEGAVVVDIPLEENVRVDRVIGELTEELVQAGVPRRTAYGLADDMRDGILKDAIAAHVLSGFAAK